MNTDKKICFKKFPFGENNWILFRLRQATIPMPKNPRYRDSRAQKNEKWRYIFRHITLQT